MISGTLNLDPKATSGLSIPPPKRLKLFISSNFVGFMAGPTTTSYPAPLKSF
ncbi:hypothetical protein C4K38_2977 [Pseudomonas chlororaphis subsp. piscium]|nr:hypothetical protein C4K38_2977 [Pseudomonas chlororaphis subsp. piscium]